MPRCSHVVGEMSAEASGTCAQRNECCAAHTQNRVYVTDANKTGSIARCAQTPPTHSTGPGPLRAHRAESVILTAGLRTVRRCSGAPYEVAKTLPKFPFTEEFMWDDKFVSQYWGLQSALAAADALDSIGGGMDLDGILASTQKADEW